MITTLVMQEDGTALTNIIFRRASAADYPGILVLHRKNLVSNLSPIERKNGFLSIDINEQQITTANKDLAVIVAVRDKSVIGYIWGTTQEYNQQFPLLKYMMSLYEETLFQRQPLSSYRSFLYGPVCVAISYRGTGVFQGLFQELLAQVALQYDAGVAFVAKDNLRSLRAHTQKLKMEVLKEFEFNGNFYFLLGFLVPPLPGK